MYKNYKIKLILVTYDTNGIDLDGDLNNIEFNPDRITFGTVKFVTPPFDIKKVSEIVDDFLDDFNEYYGEDEVDANFLPTNVKEEFDKITLMLTEIKERETQVEEFKKRLYDFMVEKEIKSVKNDSFSITRIDPVESKSVDYKSFFESYEKKYPRKARKIKSQYTKITKRKGYAKITVK